MKVRTRQNRETKHLTGYHKTRNKQKQGYKYSENRQETPGVNDKSGIDRGKTDDKEAGQERRQRPPQQQKRMVKETKEGKREGKTKAEPRCESMKIELQMLLPGAKRRTRIWYGYSHIHNKVHVLCLFLIVWNIYQWTRNEKRAKAHLYKYEIGSHSENSPTHTAVSTE